MGNPADPTFLGLEIGGSKLQLAAGAANGAIAKSQRFKVDPTLGGVGIRAQIQSVLPSFLELARPRALGVGFGGPVDWRTGRISRSHQIEGWSGFDLRSWLGTLTGLPVVVDNDANIAALGEAVLGAGAGRTPVFYVTLGSGVGGGLVVDGAIYHGAVPGESELGHVRLDREGTIVEQACSGWAVDARIRALLQTQPESVLSRLAGESPGHEARHLSAALQANDATAWALLREVAGNLAFALSHVIHLFHPAVIVLGGGLSLVGEPLRTEVARSLPGWVMEVFREGLEVRLAVLGEAAVPAGALLAAGRC
jgi:glucokinase